MSLRARTAAIGLLASACAALAAAGCGATVEVQPLSFGALQGLVQVREYPVYWLGESFRGMPLTSANVDPGGAYTLQYGQCRIGGQQTCVTPLELVSSPANGFLPGAGAGGLATAPVSIRGVHGLSALHGTVIELPTGPIVIELRASSGATALAAARQMAPINLAGAPGAPLPAPVGDTGFADRALKSQRPAPTRMLPPIPAG